MTNKITLVNDIDSTIANAHKTGGEFSFALHLAAFNCINAVDASGDIRPLNRLVEKLSPSATNALKAWCVAFGAVKWDADVLGFKLNRKVTTTDAMKADRELTGPMEYIKAGKPKTVKAFDLVAELRKLRDKAEKNNCNGPAMVFLAQAINA